MRRGLVVIFGLGLALAGCAGWGAGQRDAAAGAGFNPPLGVSWDILGYLVGYLTLDAGIRHGRLAGRGIAKLMGKGKNEQPRSG